MFDPNEPLTRADVLQGYRLVLGRSAESDDIIDGHHKNLGTLQAWRDALFNSDEFLERHIKPATVQAMDQVLYGAPPPVDHQVSPELLKAMLERIREQWTRLGEDDPHWSVLSSPEFRKSSLTAERIDQLKSSGLREAQLIDDFEARAGVNLTRGVCVELGAGVGRITRYLSERFDKVIAVDISPGNLSLCAEYMAEVGAHNVECKLISAFEDFDSLPEFDVLFSTIVLQHNPPPVQKLILRTLFSRVRPGGGVLFQIPTHIPGYTFDAEAYLAEPPSELEMHALPTAVVLEELRRNRLRLLDVTPDPFIGGLGSFTFFAAKI